MKITLLAENKSGILYQASQTIKRHRYKIKQQLKESTNNSNQILYSFMLSGDGDSEGLLEALAVIRYVQEVEIVQ